ncbi:MAG: 1,4-dihydroxy-2-naphthoate octaprenyltransferase [Bacteroidales bacterium]|nr:1,4-dihydroxy-2-naphthoate octaprenyltransferase [Bacteroidales bacterium]
MGKTSCWIEAIRLRTLPVSVAGVLAAIGYALMDGCFQPLPAVLCLVFAVLAQVASNFANEYYDFKAGLDRPGREGPRRGVTEGDISPRAMLVATFVTLGLACAVGCALIFWGGWWLVPVGITIAVGVLAYSTGPYPLSHHGLGEVAVIFFFGIIPVNMTFYLMAAAFDLSVFLGSLAIGLMGANVLLVNNYRDLEDDEAVGKRTLAVIAGRRVASSLYLINGIAAVALMCGAWLALGPVWLLIPVSYAVAHVAVWLAVVSRRGIALNPLLGATAMLMLIYAAAFLVAASMSGV